MRKQKPLAERLELLARALAGATKPRALSHAECQALLEFYVDDKHARTQYPQVARHLKTCAPCRAVYAVLTAARDERAGEPPAQARPALAFLATAPNNAGWSTRVRARVGGKPLGFGFRVQSNFLRHLLTTPSLAPVRGASAAEDGALILSDTVTLGLNDVLVEVWLHPLKKTGRARIDINVTSVEPLPEPLRMTIRWKGARYTKTLLHGQTSIAPISIAALKHAASLRVDFEAGAIGATIEEYRESL